MSETWNRLDALSRNLMPFAITLALVVVSMAPIPIPGYGAVAPMLVLMGVFYWAVYRPDLLPMSAVFVIGLVQDVLTGMALGLNSFVLLIVYGLVSSQRRVFLGKPFLVLWFGFAIAAAAAAVLSWICVTIIREALMPLAPVLFQLGLTLALFPCVAWLLIRAQRAIQAHT